MKKLLTFILVGLVFFGCSDEKNTSQDGTAEKDHRPGGYERLPDRQPLRRHDPGAAGGTGGPALGP